MLVNKSSELRGADFRALLDVIPGLCLVLLPDDPTYTIVAANSACAQLGRHDEIIGRGLFEVIPENPDDPSGAQNLRASFRQVLSTKASQSMPARRCNILAEREQGSEFEERNWRPVNSPLLGDNGEVRFIVHRMEKLPANEARFELAFAEAPIGMVLLTPDGRIVESNQAFLDMLGFTQEELAAHDSSFFTHADDIALTRNFFASLEAGPHSTGSIEKRYLRKDGELLWCRASAALRRDDLGKPGLVVAIVEDITERKRAETALRQQWHTFDIALSNTPDFTYVFDLNGRFTYINRALLTLLQKSLDEALGKNFFDLNYPPELAGRLQRQIQQVVQTREFVRDSTPFTGPTGETRYYEYIFAPVLDEEGRVEAVAGSTRDITEQNQAARQIEDDRRRWRELLGQTPAAIAVLRGPRHIFEWVNRDYARLVGRSQEALLGKTLGEALPEVPEQGYVGLLDGVFRTGQPYVGHESPVRLEQGHGIFKDYYLNFLYAATRDVAGEIDGVFVHVTDVTAMVLARKLIEDSERQFRTLAETIPHLAWMADAAGNRFWYNRRWYEYTGTSFEEVKDWGWEKAHDPAVLPSVLERWRAALSTGEPFEMVYPLRGADGLFRTFLTRIEPVKDDQDNVVRWFGTNTDITDQRRIEEELRRTNRELEEFAYVASHDMQEPLRMVNIYTQLILKNPEGKKEELALYSRFVQDGVRRMEALIQDLLTFSRTIHTEELLVGTADLSASFNEALSVLKSRIEEVGAVIHASPLPTVRGDAAQFAHVFQNVLSNALKYRKKNTAPEIRVWARQDGDRWIVSVQDNGIGFEPKYAERIFGLFKRLHKEEYAGTGLGLAICKRIVERYGGRIWAESSVGAGATFHFSLPRAN